MHKISIVQRGFGALGYTMQLPLEDRYLMTRSDLLSQLAVLLGGRTAEEIALGEISTGAQNDLQRATDIARAMVTEFGMSDALGAINYDGNKRARFLDIPMPQERGLYGEETAQKIDAEIKRILTDAHDTARAHPHRAPRQARDGHAPAARGRGDGRRRAAHAARRPPRAPPAREHAAAAGQRTDQRRAGLRLSNYESTLIENIAAHRRSCSVIVSARRGRSLARMRRRRCRPAAVDDRRSTAAARLIDGVTVGRADRQRDAGSFATAASVPSQSTSWPASARIALPAHRRVIVAGRPRIARCLGNTSIPVPHQRRVTTDLDRVRAYGVTTVVSLGGEPAAVFDGARAARHADARPRAQSFVAGSGAGAGARRRGAHAGRRTRRAAEGGHRQDSRGRQPGHDAEDDARGVSAR